MAWVRRIWRRGQLAFLALVGWLAIYGVALAQTPGEKKDEPKINSGVYVMAYMVVIFGIALGMLLVCRSSNRRERARPEQFGDTKVKEE